VSIELDLGLFFTTPCISIIFVSHKEFCVRLPQVFMLHPEFVTTGGLF